jgi:hypothetical protein
LLRPLVAALDPVGEAGDARFLGAVGAAEDPAVRLDAVADDLATAVAARRRERVDRALEAVEGVRGTVGGGHLKRLVVLVSAHLTGRHVGDSMVARGEHTF